MCEVKDLVVTLYDGDESYDINISYYYNKTIIQDLKCLLYFDLNKIDRNKKFNINDILRDRIEINRSLSDYVGQAINLKTTEKLFDRTGFDGEYEPNGDYVTLDLGKFDVIDEYTIKPCLYDNIDNCLFETIIEHSVNKYSGIWDSLDNKNKLGSYIDDYYELDKSVIIEKYVCNGLFELYYRMLVEEAKLNNKSRIEGKAAAMCSYLATKRVLNYFFDRKGLDLEVSNPNVFIKNVNIEYDALIIKKNKDNYNKFIFDEGEVEAIIELKTSGCFFSKDDLKKGEFINYISRSNPLKKKFIYLSLYESFGDRDTSVHYYEYLLCNFLTLGKLYFGIFCATKKNQKNLLIPYQYDLERKLKEIFKKSQ